MFFILVYIKILHLWYSKYIIIIRIKNQILLKRNISVSKTIIECKIVRFDCKETFKEQGHGHTVVEIII